MSNEDLIRQANIQEIAREGTRIYEEIKSRYEPQHNGKFLAIDIETKNAYMGEITSDAVEQARAAHPQRVFYVVKIGFSVSEVLASLQAVEPKEYCPNCGTERTDASPAGRCGDCGSSTPPTEFPPFQDPKEHGDKDPINPIRSI